MAYDPVSRTVPQYQVDGNTIAAGYFLKGYTTATTTPLSMATDDTGGTLLVKCKLNTAGYPLSNDADDTSVFIPHFNNKFKLALYTNTIDADNNTTANAVWVVDGIPINTILSESGISRVIATSDGADIIGTLFDLINAASTETIQGIRKSIGGVRLRTIASNGNFNISQTTSAGVVEDNWITMVRNGAVGQRFNGTEETATKSGGFVVNNELEIQGLSRYSGTVQTLTGAGAVNITTAITEIVTTGADALTLVDGAQGQRKFIVMKTDGGAGTLTPSNLGNGSTITFDDVGDSADLIFTNAAWHFIGGTATLA